MTAEAHCAVITGAAGDLGWAMARRLSGLAENVVICDRNATILAKPLANNIQAYVFDLTIREKVLNFIETILNKYSYVDVLVNNAAKQHDGDVVETSSQDFLESFLINMNAPHLFCQGFIPGMKNAGGGAIINVSSVHALAAGPERFAYASTKAGLLGLSRSIAVDFGRFGIRCNSVVPTAIRTSGLEKAWKEERGHDGDTVDLYAHAAFQHPLRRIGEADEVAELVEFLVKAKYITGQTVRIDGGLLSALRLLPGE